MKVALITTTINVPSVLRLYREHGSDVQGFVAGDLKTPTMHEALASDGWTYLSPEQQRAFGYKCSEAIGWNCIQRRNIATLEALKSGADVIVSIDDDNIPLTDPARDYFSWFTKHFKHMPAHYHGSIDPDSYLGDDGEQLRFSGIAASSGSGWFDVGTLLDPIASHRGFPRSKKAEPFFKPVVGAKVGVAAGICLGDPDIDAVTRMANAPIVHRVSELLHSGVLVDTCTCKTVFNSQNTAFIRELAPAFFMFPGLGRYDDICASLLMQRVMSEKGLHVHFGKPFVWQQRNQHDLVKDLDAELWGMAHIERFAKLLDYLKFNGNGNVLEMCRHVCVNLGLWRDWFPPEATTAFHAYLDDCEMVLA